MSNERKNKPQAYITVKIYLTYHNNHLPVGTKSFCESIIILSKDNNIFLRKWKATLTHVDQYLSRDSETLDGTKITEALRRAFQTLKK